MKGNDKRITKGRLYEITAVVDGSPWSRKTPETSVVGTIVQPVDKGDFTSRVRIVSSPNGALTKGDTWSMLHRQMDIRPLPIKEAQKLFRDQREKANVGW